MKAIGGRSRGDGRIATGLALMIAILSLVGAQQLIGSTPALVAQEYLAVID